VKLSRKLGLLLIAAALVSPSFAHGAEMPGEQFVVGPPPGDTPSLGVVIEDSQKLKNTFSTLQAFTADGVERGRSKVKSITNCKSYGEAGCEQYKYFNYMANLDMCSTSLTQDCIQSVFARDKNGKDLKVDYVSAFPQTMPYAYKGNLQVKLPTGGSNFIVDIPEAKHVGGTQYLVVAQFTGMKDFGATNFQLDSFNLGIFAVSKVAGRISITGPSVDLGPSRVLGQISNQRIPFDQNTGTTASCTQSTATECLLAWPMPLDVEFGVVINANTRINGWLHGRTSNTAADIKILPSGDQLITVSGNPSIVPTVYTWFPKSNLPKTISDYYQKNREELLSGTGFGGNASRDFASNSSLLKDTIDYSERQLTEALAWYEALGDKAPYASTQWSIRSTNSGNDQKGCFRNNAQLSGIVATNSNFFFSGPPVFNANEHSLDYKVASPHLLPNSDVFKGSYNLLIKSDVARCIYGFTSAPVSASVSIVSSDGTASIATVVLGERNRWLYLTAAGFTFSAPTVRVKLTQAAESVTAPSATSKTSAVAAKKTSITCVKGKTSKKVTAVKPKCPVGYKKK
jgi:hypothetical protein